MDYKDVLVQHEMAAQAPQQPQQSSGLIQRLLELLSGKTGATAERDRMQPPANTTGPRG